MIVEYVNLDNEIVDSAEILKEFRATLAEMADRIVAHMRKHAILDYPCPTGRVVYRESTRAEALKESHVVNALTPHMSLRTAMDTWNNIQEKRNVVQTERLFRVRPRKGKTE